MYEVRMLVDHLWTRDGVTYETREAAENAAQKLRELYRGNALMMFKQFKVFEVK